MDADLAFRAVCRALVLPPLGPILLGLGGVAALSRWPRVGRGLIVAALGALLLLAVPAASDRLLGFVERYPPLAAVPLPEVDAIVVLSGGIRRNSPRPGQALPSPATLERLAEAAGLARATGLPLLLSGGVVEGGPAEADVMQRALRRDFGISARWLERRSRTTRENARESAALLGALHLSRVVLVTSAVHLRRAVAEFEAAGLVVTPAPAGPVGEPAGGPAAWLPSAAALERSTAALYELAGELVARLDRRR